MHKYFPLADNEIRPRVDTWPRDKELIWDTAKTRGQPPQVSALEPQGEPGSQRSAALSASVLLGAPFAAGWASGSLSHVDNTMGQIVDLFTSSLYSALTPVSIPYHAANPYKNGFQEESVFPLTSPPNNFCLSGRYPEIR